MKIIDGGKEMYEKEKTLKKIKVDLENWTTYYSDLETGEKWIKEYPFPEMQAGGPPQMRLLEKFPWE